MNLMKTFAASAALACAGLSASAETVLSATKDWVVVLDTFSDGTPFCEARTYREDFSFSVYFGAGGPATLQLFFADMDLGVDQMDFAVQIDNRKPWTLNDADTMTNSIFFTLPRDSTTTRFLTELYLGRNLFFLGASGERLWSVSLAGSAASMQMLSSCRDAIG